MSVNKLHKNLFIALAAVLLLAGAVFAFPHDPQPSTIYNPVPGNAAQSAAAGGFPGDWTNSWGTFALNNTRLFNYLKQEFSKVSGAGGSKDLKIWNTPTFHPDVVSADNAAWEHMLDTPSVAVPTTIRAIYTNHDAFIKFVEDLPRTNLTVEYLGEIPRGFPFPFLVFSKNPDRTPAGLAATGKPLIWAQGNIHGGEWSGPESVLAMAYSLAHGVHDDLLEKVNVILVPRICADGAKRPIRTTNDLVALNWTAAPSARDLNRDNLLLDLPVQRALGTLRDAYYPHFLADMHERGAASISSPVSNDFGILADWNTNDIGASGTLIPQPGKDLIRLRLDYMEPDLNKMGLEYGLTFGWYTEGPDQYYQDSRSTNLQTQQDYFTHPEGMYRHANLTSSMVTSKAFDPDAPYLLINEANYNPRTANNITAMPGIVVQLFENKAGPSNVGGKAMWERRVATGYVCILSTMTTAANRPELITKINEIRKNNIEKGKTVSTNDMIPILYHPPMPRWFTEDRTWPIVDLNREYTNQQGSSLSARDMTGITMYDASKALRKVATGTGFNGSDYEPAQGNGSRDHQFFKVTYNWESNVTRERIRPYAYLLEGPYANEVVTRMMLAGIQVKRLAEDVKIDVEGWHYNARIPISGQSADLGGPVVDTTDAGAGGWRNRDVTVFPIQGREFKKDAFVVYLAQKMNNLIPMYMEPDMPWNVASVIFLTNMSAALGGASNGWLSPQLIGMEMPAYRYLKEVDLPTYDINHFHPLVNRGAVARYYAYHTQDSNKKAADVLAAQLKIDLSTNIAKVFDYDFHVHTRTDALVGGKFDITLPTSSAASDYYILKKDGSYEPMAIAKTKTVGWNVGSVVLASHGLVPWTVDLDSNGRPKVDPAGAARTVFRELRDFDDLFGVRIIEIAANPISLLFKGGKLPVGTTLTENGIKYTDMLNKRSNTILSETDLDGWKIISVTPTSGNNWSASIINGEVVVKFPGDAYDQAMTVTLEKIGTGETQQIAIEFSGENWLDNVGCNTGTIMLALLAICPLFIRRKI